MEIICTPYNGALALIVDIDTGRVTRKVDLPEAMKVPTARPFGIAPRGDGTWYIASHDRIGHFDGDFNLLSLQTGLPGNIHQIQYDAISDRLWVAATSIDSLLSINTHTQQSDRFCLLTDEWIPYDAPGSDTQHFNSLSWRGDRLHVVAHMLSTTNSFVRTYDRGMRRQSEWHAGREAHCICDWQGEMLLLDSRGGAILGNRGLNIQVAESIHYTRGMAITPDGRAVVAAFAFGARATRHTGDAYLRVYDLGARRQIGEFRLTGTGNIQDIQLWNPMAMER
jgi:hypothetical protein